MKCSFVVFLLALGVAFSSSAQEIRLAPVDPDTVGDWAKPALPFRLHPTLDRDVEYQGPALPMQLWGDLSLGNARYALVLGISETGAAGLWLDQNRDDVIATEELLSGGRGNGYYLWQVELAAEVEGESYPYPLGLLWPEGRGYIYLIGGAPHIGTINSGGQGHTLVLVDGDINGVFGTEGDFYAVDVDGDDTIYGDADGHEHFAIDEAFTLGERSFRLAQVSPAGSLVRLEETEYVPPKLPLTPGHPAPDFSFTTLRDGRRLSLSDVRGKVVLLDFWATWCEPCMAELPNVKEIYKKHHDQGFEIIGISLDTSESALRSELQKQGISWPQYYDGKGWENRIAALYRVFAIPATFLLDREGVIRYRDLRGQELAEKVAELLAEPAPEEAPPPVKTPPEVTAPPEPILELTLPSEVGLVPGKETELSVQVENTSPYLAEEITLRFVELPEGATAEPGGLAELPAFGQRSVTLAIRAPEGMPQGNYPTKLVLTYHYCIGESCFQISDEAELVLAVGERPTAPRRPWSPWWLLVILGVGVALAWLVLGKGASALGIFLILAAGAAVGVGVYLGQARQAQLIGAVLCTSCVGIEEVHPEVPQVSAATREALAQLSRPVKLVVFHTPWCHSCPFAIAMAQEFARLSPNIDVELVDAEENPKRAEAAGVYRSGRLIVPAVLAPATGQVIFGTRDLESRLLDLVEGAAR